MFREFQLRQGLPAISEDLESAIIAAKDYNTFIKLLNEVFPLFLIQKEFFSASKNYDQFAFNNKKLVYDGLHPFRRWVAQIAHQKKVDSEVFTKRGYIKEQLELSEEDIRSAIEEFEPLEYSVNKQRFNLLTINPLLKTLNRIHRLIEPTILACIETNSSQDAYLKYDSNTFAQKVYNQPNDSDDQKQYHCDTFFPAIKWWWFPEEVTKETGAFWYAPDSCFLVDNMLDWIYNESIKIFEKRVEEWRGSGHFEGSLRISEGELALLGFMPMPIEVKKNTLVIANVAGFHKRGDVKKPSIRNALHGSIRLDNPFNFDSI